MKKIDFKIKVPNLKTKKMDMSQLKSINWRSLAGMFSTQSANNLNAFLEKLPQNSNKTLLTITGIVWASAAAMGLYTTVQTQGLTKLRAELQEAKATKPTVPTIKNAQAANEEIDQFVENAKEVYGGLNITASSGTIAIVGETTAAFGQFREAIGHVQNRNRQWQVNVEKLCVGRECDGKPLTASLKISKVDIQ